MTNAPAPMTGGMSCPPVDAAATTPAANRGVNPERTIIGMVMTPVETVVATADPDTDPMSPDPNTAT